MLEEMKQYFFLMRLHKPIGIFLLLWPTLWALWLAGNGKPNLFIVGIFILGVILMRSAGCIINDVADRHVDSYVARTRTRPLATGKLTSKQALLLFSSLIFCAFLLVLLLNRFTIWLAFVGVVLVVLYPFMKRFTHLPQVGLGIAFAWGVLMAFAAQNNSLSPAAWLLFFAAAVWPVIYDTMYAMVDYEDDIKIGIKSTAILFRKYDRWVIGVLQISFIALMAWVGYLFKLNIFYFLSLLIVTILFGYQQQLIKDQDQKKCLKAFLNNNWVGMILFVGIILSYV